MVIHEPSVAGTFYQSSDMGLRKQIESCFLDDGGPGRLPVVDPEGPRAVVGLLCPHAGLMYSGSVAAWSYSRLAEDGLPDTAILIGPNHRSYFPAVAVSGASEWRTPFGSVAVDTDLAASIASRWDVVQLDESAHRSEHSLEVQLPFLQYLSEIGGKDIRIVPILIGAAAGAQVAGGELEVARKLGESVALALEGHNAVIIASSDFTHYESGESALAKDSLAISAVLDLDEQALIDTVRENGITMCGFMPTAVTIAACKRLGASYTRKLAYRNSGDVTGDYSEVVGYGAIEIGK